MPEDSQTAVKAEGEPAGARSGDGRWCAPAEQLLAAVRGPVIASLPELGVVTVTGADAETFLNAQLTIDVKTVDAHRWQLGAYCSAKGRTRALFEIWRLEQGYGLTLPAPLAQPLCAALAKFVLRSRVQLQEATSHWSFLGLVGPGADQALQAADLQAPEAAWTCAMLEGGARLVRLPAGKRSASRLLLMTPASDAASWRRRLSAFTSVDAGVWWWSKIDAALPDVFTMTQERFVPQMLNLDVLGGVHFRKGCYPGQEVVARSQYLGKLRRRMMLGHAQEATGGEDVYAGDEPNAAPVGTVVMAAAAPGGGVDLLFECPTEEATQLRVGTQRRDVVSLLDLPYPMINPTA